MTKSDFQELANASIRHLIPYQPGKPIEELERELGISSSIKLASNENPLGPSPIALLYAQSVLGKAHIYPDGGSYELKQVLSQHLSLQPNQLTIGNGSENVLEIIIKTYLSENDTAVISQYAFLTIPLLISSYGAQAKVVPAKEWGHDIQGMINAIDEKTRIVFLVNPNNPTGTYTNDDDFRQLMNHVPNHVLVVVDEAYSEYISQDDYPNTLSYLEQYPNLVVTRTFSKVYGLASLRLGYAASSPDIADMLNRARLPFNVNAIAAKAGVGALQDHEHLHKSIACNNAGMKQIQEGLQQLNLSYIPSIANFITIDVSDANACYQQLLFEGVIVRPLTAYQMPRHIRVTVGTPQENQRFLSALNKILSINNIFNQETRSA